jgi:hypothetical protein
VPISVFVQSHEHRKFRLGERGEVPAIAAMLRDTVAADRFPLSPRVRRWEGNPR